jgi:hypothetical protein
VAGNFEGFSMRPQFFDPRRDEVAAVATDLITRFGLRAHDEAVYLAELAAQMRSRRAKALYGLVVREIDASFLEAQRRLGLRQGASDTVRPADRARDGTELTNLDRLVLRVRSRTAETPTSLVAVLNRDDINPSPRRRIG